MILQQLRSRLTLRRVLLLIAACFVAMTMGVVGMSLIWRTYTERASRQTEALTAQFLPGLVAVAELQDAALNLKSVALEFALARDNAATERQQAAFAAYTDIINTKLAELTRQGHDPLTRQLITEFADSVADYLASANTFQAQLNAKAFETAMDTLDGSLGQAQTRLQTRLRALSTRYTTLSQQASMQTAQVLAESERVGRIAILALAAFTLVAVLFTVSATHAALTQIRVRDEERQAAHDLLEKRVQERTAELQETHRELVEASRRAGQAEVATSVLHNVGNVLNSVGVSATLAAQRLRNAKFGNVAMAAHLLEERRQQLGPFFTEDAKGRLFIDYLRQLSSHLDSERQMVVEELDGLMKNVEHIREIVAMQQSYARVHGVLEIIRPVEVLDHALTLNAESLAKHDIRVERQIEDVPPCAIDRHQVLQILVNLIANARNALKEVPHERTIVVTLETSGDSVRYIVTDNGVGIPPENLQRIFQHGYTTRMDGHGFGLHSGALAAKQLGGSLSSHSAGTGMGATFTLQLPRLVQKAETAEGLKG